MVDITWLGETHHGVNEYICMSLASSSNGELSMGSVHRVTSLESDNFPPCEFLEMCAQFRWGIYVKPQPVIAPAECKLQTYNARQHSQSGWVT